MDFLLALLRYNGGVVTSNAMQTGGMNMTYKTVVIDYAPRANTMSDKIEETANDMAQQGWELAAFSVTNSAKAILVFRTTK